MRAVVDLGRVPIPAAPPRGIEPREPNRRTKPRVGELAFASPRRLSYVGAGEDRKRISTALDAELWVPTFAVGTIDGRSADDSSSGDETSGPVESMGDAVTIRFAPFRVDKLDDAAAACGIDPYPVKAFARTDEAAELDEALR